MQWQKSRAINSFCACKKDSSVRGVSFETFRASVKEFWRCDKSSLLDTSWQLWKAEKWQELERFFIIHKLNDCWPPDSGAASLEIVTLDTGTLIDRYGGKKDSDSVFSDWGKFVSAEGVPLPNRALPLGTVKSPYKLYKVIKAIPNTKKGCIIPWFNQPGLGIQYLLPASIESLKCGGFIAEANRNPTN